MKKLGSILPIIMATLAAGQAWAGNLTVEGYLTVSSNLTAQQSITLGGETRTNWPGGGSGNYLPLQGSKYVIVAEGTNDVHRGSNLRAAYATACGLAPSTINRVAVIVPPGTYNLNGTDLSMSANYVDLIGLVPAQMTTKQVFMDLANMKRSKTIANVRCHVRIYGAALTQSAGDVRIESLIVSNYYPTVVSTNTVLRHVAMTTMRGPIEYAGQYSDCVGGNSSFSSGYDPDRGTASGTFIDCVGGGASFGAGDAGTASGTFIDCTGGGGSFGINNGAASGTFIRCVGGEHSFANAGTASGTFIDCVGSDASFGGDPGGAASGIFINCVGGEVSFATSLQGPIKILMMRNLPTSSSGGLPSGSLWNDNGTLKIKP